MKRKIHQALLGLSILVLIPGVGIAGMLIIGAVASGFTSGLSLSDSVAIGVLMIPPIMLVWGVRLFSRCEQGFLPCVRRSLLAYYGAFAIHCGLWLGSTHGNGESVTILFSRSERLVGMILLSIPLITALLMKPDAGEGEDSKSSPPNIPDISA